MSNLTIVEEIGQHGIEVPKESDPEKITQVCPKNKASDDIPLLLEKKTGQKRTPLQFWKAEDRRQVRQQPTTNDFHTLRLL